jgi:hypothetical protein
VDGELIVSVLSKEGSIGNNCGIQSSSHASIITVISMICAITSNATRGHPTMLTFQLLSLC